MPKSQSSIVVNPLELEYVEDLRTPESCIYEHWKDPPDESKSFAERTLKLINGFKRCQYITAEGTQDALKWRTGMRAVEIECKKKFPAVILFSH